MKHNDDIFSEILQEKSSYICISTLTNNETMEIMKDDEENRVCLVLLFLLLRLYDDCCALFCYIWSVIVYLRIC